MAVTVPAGYALGRLRLRGRSALVGLLLGSRTLPPVSVALPYYFYFTALHLRGTIAGLVIIQMSITIPIVTWVLMGFFSALPRDIEMSARMDGCTRFQAFYRALLPLAAPGIAASAVIAFLFSWNDFFYSWLISSGSPAPTYNTFLTAFFAGDVWHRAGAHPICGGGHRPDPRRYNCGRVPPEVHHEPQDRGPGHRRAVVLQTLIAARGRPAGRCASGSLIFTGTISPSRSA